jgi:hypothetical protein
MTIFQRFKYAWALNVLLVGVGVVIAMIFRLDIGETIFSGKIFYPLLIVGFLLAPIFEKYLKYK